MLCRDLGRRVPDSFKPSGDPSENHMADTGADL